MNLPDTLKVPLRASSDWSNSLGAFSRTIHVTSDGFTSFSANARAALRQPSKSVSRARVMVGIQLSLPSRHTFRRHPRVNAMRHLGGAVALATASKDGPRAPPSFEARKRSHLRMTFPVSP